MSTLPFEHRYVRGARPDAPTLLMLHGTGGNEDDLLPIAHELLPGAAVLSPRGKVLEQGMPRFFRRLAEGVFDLEDLKFRTGELADFVGEASDHYGFDSRRVVAAGFSNGANIASSLLLLRPTALSAAILFRGMVPIVPDVLPNLEGRPVLISNGKSDPLVSVAESERLAELLSKAEADVTLAWQAAGHNLTIADVTRARTWLASLDLDPSVSH